MELLGRYAGLQDIEEAEVAPEEVVRQGCDLGNGRVIEF